MSPPIPSQSRDSTTRLDVLVVGAGQAGLSAGYYLAQSGLRFAILEGGARVGDVWRKRWDSLRLFSPASLDGLVGMPFPGPRGHFPTKDEMGDYLGRYAARFALPVRCNVKVTRIVRRNHVYVVESDRGTFEAAHVVLAVGSYVRPKFPAFARDLDPDIVQLHSSAYRSPTQMGPGAVLIVGAGNSGSELAMELSATHHVTLAGRDTGHLPFRPGGWFGRHVLTHLLLRFFFHYVLTLRTPMGRGARPRILGKGGPLIRVRPEGLAARGVVRSGRVVAVQEGRPVLEDERVVDVRNVIWATGFRPAFDFIDLPIFEPSGEPHHTRGIAHGQPGVYFLGMHFQYAMSSSMVHGVGRDAAYVVDTIRARAASRGPSAAREGALATA